MSKTRNHEFTGFQKFLSSSVIQIVATILLMLFLFGSSALIAYQSGKQKNQIPETNQKASEEKFCGGIAGVVCPEGYTCKLDGKYPDASGVCIKK